MKLITQKIKIFDLSVYTVIGITLFDVSSYSTKSVLKQILIKKWVDMKVKAKQTKEKFWK